MVWAVSHDTKEGDFSRALGKAAGKKVEALAATDGGTTTTTHDQCKWTNCGEGSARFPDLISANLLTVVQSVPVDGSVCYGKTMELGVPSLWSISLLVVVSAYINFVVHQTPIFQHGMSLLQWLIPDRIRCGFSVSKLTFTVL